MEKTPNNISLEEIIYKLRKKLIEDVRKLDDGVVISLKDYNNDFDDSIIQLLLFDCVYSISSDQYNPVAAQEFEKDYRPKNHFSYYPDHIDLARGLSRHVNEKYQVLFAFLKDKQIMLDTTYLLNVYKKDKYKFFYTILPKICDKPWEAYFDMEFVLLNDGKTAKKFALPEDVLKRLDFTGISFDNFMAYKYDFSELHGVSINPNKVFKKSLWNSNLNGVSFTKTLDEDVIIQGANFTGSANVAIDIDDYLLHPIKFFNLNAKTNFTDVTFFHQGKEIKSDQLNKMMEKALKKKRKMLKLEILKHKVDLVKTESDMRYLEMLQKEKFLLEHILTEQPKVRKLVKQPNNNNQNN